MKRTSHKSLTLVVVAITLLGVKVSNAQATSARMATEIPPSITTPNRIETRRSTLEFTDGVPSKATAEKVYDNLDFTYAYRAFMDNLRGVSVHAMRKGVLDFGVKDNEVLAFSSWRTPSRCSSQPTPTRSTPSVCSISRTDPSYWRCRPSSSAPSTTTGSGG